MAAGAVRLLTGASVILLEIAACVWPLQGLNRLLVEQKRRLKAIAGQRLRMSIENLTCSLDEDELGKFEPPSLALEAADLEMRIVERIPMWPWQPSSPGTRA